MASLEHRVISELLRSRDMGTAMKLGLNKAIFKGAPEDAQIWEFIRNHYHDTKTYKQFPLIRTIKRRWPNFEMTAKADQGRLATLIVDLKNSRLGVDLKGLVDYFNELTDEDPEAAVKHMMDELGQLRYNYTASGSFGVREIADGVREAYEAAQTGAIYGIPWPWEPLTIDTMGKSKGDFIVFYGRMKSMKTWIMLFSAIEDFIVHKKRVLIWSREMDEKKIKLRAGSILGRVDYQCLKHGNLPAPLFSQAMNAMDTMARLIRKTEKQLKEGAKHGVPDLIILCGRNAPKTLEEVKTAIDIYQPDIAYLDSFYHLQSDRSAKYKQRHEQQLYLAEDIKSAAMDLDIPIVGSAQANREGEKTAGEHMADVAGTDAIAREADTVIRVIMRRGRAPHEDEYEGYWETEKEAEAHAELRRQAMTRLRVTDQWKNGHDKPNGKSNGHVKGPQIARHERPMGDKRKERASAEIALILGGNREGVLQGLLLNVIPGYKNKILRDDFTSKEAKEWIQKDEEKEGGGGGGGRRQRKEERPQPLVGVGKGFSKQHRENGA